MQMPNLLELHPDVLYRLLNSSFSVSDFQAMQQINLVPNIHNPGVIRPVPPVIDRPSESKKSNEMKSSSDIDFEMGSLPTSSYYPTHFMRGTKLQIGSSGMKKVEDISTDDFLKCAALSEEISVSASVITKIKKSQGSVEIQFNIAMEQIESSLKVQTEHPFFVLGKGWSSCDPRKTVENYGLTASELQIGDVCVVMTRNGPEEKDKLEEAIIDILTAEREFEIENRRSVMRDDMIEVYYEHVSGRVSAPPERLFQYPFQQRSRKMSE